MPPVLDRTPASESSCYNFVFVTPRALHSQPSFRARRGISLRLCRATAFPYRAYLWRAPLEAGRGPFKKSFPPPVRGKKVLSFLIFFHHIGCSAPPTPAPFP